VVHVTARTLYPLAKSPWYLLERKEVLWAPEAV
jgi:hypothetical protein